MNRPESIALVDLNYLFKKRYHTVGNETPMAAAKATLRDLEELSKDVGHLIVCRDAPPYQARQAIFPEYKANRPRPEPEETAQKKYLWNALKKSRFNVAWCQGYEADDVIATLCKAYSWCSDVRIVGADKDCAQCITAFVKQYIPPVGADDWVERGVAEVQEKWGVFPEFFPLYQALCGDSADNIPGVKGIGPVSAKMIVNKCQTLERVAEWAATANVRESKLLLADWAKLEMSLKLVTLDTNVELDAEGLLVPREPEPELEVQNDMATEETVIIERNETPMPPANEVEPPPSAARDVETEEWREKERRENGEHDAREVAEQPKAPGMRKAVAPPPEAPAKRAVAHSAELVPAYTQSKYGMVTAELQPLDLTAAYQMSEWLFKGGLYQQFKSASQIFTIMMRAKELGIGVTTALAGFHIIEGKPSASADFIRALVERDPNFEYLMPIEMSPTTATWEGKHRRQPKSVRYTYTIEDAKQAGLVRLDRYGKPGAWMLRPQDFLVKTAGSKLSRLLWPGASMGLYCAEEMGYSQEELEREAA